MDDAAIDPSDQPKKSTRNKQKKYFYDYEEIPDEDSPKRKYKKRLKDRKSSASKKGRLNGDYSDDDEDEQTKKIKKKVKLNPDEIKLIRRLKRTSKPTFNPKLLEESKIKRDELSSQLKEIEEVYGKFQPKLGEPKKVQTLWDFVVKQAIDVANLYIQMRKFKIFKAKKLAIGSQFAFKNRMQSIIHRSREEQFKLYRTAVDISKLVQKEFWKNVYKLHRYQVLQAQQELHLKSQQKRLESFVNKQLILSTKMAGFLQEAVPSDKEESEEEVKSEEAEEEEDEDEEKTVVIQIGKDDNGFLVQDITVEKASIETKKDNLKEIADLASQYQPKGFTLNTVEVKIKQPFLVKGQLREYQQIGLNWLAMLHQKRINGILADEMGLGKTIQTISLLAHLACDKGIWGPHLIVVPTSILVNWEIEFKRWCPALKVMTYFGSPKERKAKRMGWSRVNFFHVCITSYKLALQDKKIFRRKRWYYMILDEAHNIKNFKSQRWQVLLNFHSKRRLLITGTPLQNDVGELWSLMHFLMPNIFHSHSDFNEWFLVPMQQAIQKNQPVNMGIIQQLHSILRPFLLRRLKKDVEKQLPSKTEKIIRCPLSRRQKYLYDEFINRDETKIRIHGQEFLGLMNVLMQLRKVCNHPDLFEARAIESAVQMPKINYSVPLICLLHFYFNELPLDGIYGSNFFENETNVKSLYNYDRLLALLPKREHLQKILQYNITSLDKLKAHFSYKWKKIKANMRNQNVERTFLQNCYNAYYCKPIYGADQIKYIEELCDIKAKERTLFQYGLVTDLDSRIFSLKYMIDNYLFCYEPATFKPINFYPSKYSLKHERIINSLNDVVEPNLTKIMNHYHYTLIRSKLVFPDKKFLIYDCGKLNSMMQLLIRLKTEKHKVLIFTQMSKMLDLFEFSLNVFHMTYVRLDGATRPDTRQKLVERFNNDSKIFCFISSTRSGGIGINLTGADTVIFYDTDWNPAMDKQAQDRCHRIGQTRNVTIYRLISEFTIEENILLKNMQKRQLDEFIMEEGQFTMDFFEKINMKDVLGDMLISDKTMSKMSYKQFEKVLETVEDGDDVAATKNATKEQEDMVLEDIKFDAPTKGLEDTENPTVDRNMLPPLYNYGLDFTEYYYGKDHDGLDIEDQENEEKDNHIQDENGGGGEEEDFDFAPNFNQDSDEEDVNKTMGKKQAKKAYQDTKKLIVQNYFL